MNETDSILTSVKTLLGIMEDCEEFDEEILMHINAAIAILRQLGVGPKELYIVTDKNQIYEDYLGVGSNLISMVKLYLFHKVKLGWDPPESTAVMESLKLMIQEDEFRLNAEVDPETTFE